MFLIITIKKNISKINTQNEYHKTNHFLKNDDKVKPNGKANYNSN